MKYAQFERSLTRCSVALFDLDNTVIDGEASAGIGYGYLKREVENKRYGNATIGVAGGLLTNLFSMAGFDTLGLRTFIGALNLARCADRESAYQFAEAYVRKHGLPGVREFVDYLKRQGMHTAVYTGGLDVSARAAQNEFGFDGNFASYSFDGNKIKPFSKRRPSKKEIAELYLRLKEKYLRNCLVVGDASTDIPLMVESGLSLASPLATSRVKEVADYRAENYESLMRELTRLPQTLF